MAVPVRVCHLGTAGGAQPPKGRPLPGAYGAGGPAMPRDEEGRRGREQGVRKEGSGGTRKKTNRARAMTRRAMDAERGWAMHTEGWGSVAADVVVGVPAGYRAERDGGKRLPVNNY